jgi:hypothetical protein
VQIAALLLIPLGSLLLGSELFADSPSGEVAPAAAVSFDHEAHAKELKDKSCSQCHVTGESARPAPTTRAHAPCLASGCHIDQFLSTGPRTKKEDPKAYAEAANFCSLCHKGKPGEPPKRFSKAPADALFENKSGANFHVEMNHYEHTKRTKCSTCHVVDATSFALVKGRPNHLECRNCHDDSELPMSDCATCHSTPGPAAYFTKTRKASDVRSCDSADASSKRPCFKHERQEHRFRKDVALECSSCHYMFKKKKYNGKSYTTLADVKAAPIMDNRRDMAHENCGSSGCHKREVDDSMGTGRCGLCHSKEFMASGLLD